ncbi:MAG: sigma-70 family RNA polymerase sigma factor, partial [Actinomycetota bacterium]
TLLRTYQHWRKASANPPAYGRTVLVNLCRDHWRSGRRAHEFPAQPSSLDRVAQADAANAIIDRVAMEQALRVLSQQQRQVLVLRYFSDLSLADTAELLNLAEGTVKSTASRALAKLREELLAQQRKEAPVAD